MNTHKAVKHDKDLTIIVGCGRLGATIARDLSIKGKDVVIIDSDASSFRRLQHEFGGFNIEGDGTDIDVLKESNIAKAGTFVAVTEDDNTNLLIAQIAKCIFNVPIVVARVYDWQKNIINKEYDIKTIQPSVLSLNAFNSMLTDGGEK